MGLGTEQLTVVHVEDDPDLAAMVNVAFSRFGFRGSLVSFAAVDEALEFFAVREKRNLPVHLVITDMQLPDGTGLDLLHQLRSSAKWRLTPVVVFSADRASQLVRDSYAAGANLFLSKLSETGTSLETLQSLYKCWLDSALLPASPSLRPVELALDRGVRIRSRIAHIYLAGARRLPESDDKVFWLERYLNESNIANLLALAGPFLEHYDMPARLLARYEAMQHAIERRLPLVEEMVDMADPLEPEILAEAVLGLLHEADEHVIGEILADLFELTPDGTEALVAYASVQLRSIGEYALATVEDRGMRAEAVRLLNWADDLRGE